MAARVATQAEANVLGALGLLLRLVLGFLLPTYRGVHTSGLSDVPPLIALDASITDRDFRLNPLVF